MVEIMKITYRERGRNVVVENVKEIAISRYGDLIVTFNGHEEKVTLITDAKLKSVVIS